MFAAAQPVERDTLARVVERDCSLDLLIDDIQAELSGRPYELVKVVGGYVLRTRDRYAEAPIWNAYDFTPTSGGLEGAYAEDSAP